MSARQTAGQNSPHDAPLPPDELRKRQRKRRLERSHGAGSLARFFTKQVLWFIGLVFALLLIDVFLYILIATHEMDRNYLFGTPATVTRTVSDQLTRTDGAYALQDNAAQALNEQGAWAQLIAADGSVLWSYNAPTSDEPVPEVTAREKAEPYYGLVPERYTTNQIALIARYQSLNGYPTFIWTRDDGLLLVGFPPGSYETMIITWPKETWTSLPGYVAGIILLDLLILFVAYVLYRRRTQRAVEPINNALGALSKGMPAQVDLKGDLQPIADQLNETSDLLERKDQAREAWIRGVSHDIRTPLSMIIGRADGIAQSPKAPESLRAEARAIRTQGLKIKDLVADLNAASQLSFSAQPLNLQLIHLPKLLRSCAASYLNSGFDETHPLEFLLADNCESLCVLGDERMLVRLTENLLANARLHNPDGCAVTLSLSLAKQDGSFADLQVSDNGVGVSAAALAKLEERLQSARVAPGEAVPDSAGHGLGLVLVDRIARAHGGALEIAASAEGGFLAHVLIPCTALPPEK